MDTLEADVTVIGAGVIGLAIAAAVARPERQLLVLERHPRFGQETSSRHSGVIHAGIYYPVGSLKARLCIRGRRLLYETCERYSIPHKRLGKLIVAAEDDEISALEALYRRGLENGVEELRLLSAEEARSIEPNVRAAAAILSPVTGIIDDHALMRLYAARAAEGGTLIAYGKTVTAIERLSDGYRLTVEEDGGRTDISTRILINAAGLAADTIAEMAGLDADRLGYRLHFCLGEYFRLSRGRPVERPVYPLPEAAGLGIHLTPDMDGAVRLGPNARYVDDISYVVDEGQRDGFYRSVRRYLPSLCASDIQPDFAGVRPKLQGPGEPVRDFVISHEAENGYPGLINLIGIESPGLTASPAIAETVEGMVRSLS